MKIIVMALIALIFVGCGDGSPNGEGSFDADGNPWICKMDLFSYEIDPNNVCACLYTAPDASYNVINECNNALFDNKADCVQWDDPRDCFCRRYMCGQYGDECVCGGYHETYTYNCKGNLCCANFDDGTCYCNPVNSNGCDSLSGYVNVISCDADYILPRLMPLTSSGGTRVDSCTVR